MININQEKAYIQSIDKKVRDLEMEKVRLEQQKEYTQKSIDENLAKMQELGFTPDTIDAGIEQLSSSITTLKGKIESILNNVSPAKEEENSLDF